jgi:hypothetical protein
MGGRVIGTPQERFDKRMARAREIGRRNAIFNRFDYVQDGTLAKLDHLRKQSGLSMDNLLWRLARLGEKYGI